MTRLRMLLLAGLVVVSSANKKYDRLADDERAVFDAVSVWMDEDAVKAFLKLKDQIDGIVDLEWGASENIEPLANGFTHSFLVTFKDKAGLAAYLPHPAHEAFVAILKPHLEKVYVFDYTAKK